MANDSVVVDALNDVREQHRTSGPGTFIHNRPGSSHQPSSPDGCTFLAAVTRK